MTTDNTLKLFDSATKLLGVIAWPAVLVFVVIRFGPALRDFIASMGELTLKGAGFEASAKRKQVEAAAALAAAAVSHPEPGANSEASAGDARAAVQVVAELVTPRLIRRAGRATVLWVDDRPNNNLHERQALEALGVRFVLARSTHKRLRRSKISHSMPLSLTWADPLIRKQVIRC